MSNEVFFVSLSIGDSFLVGRQVWTKTGETTATNVKGKVESFSPYRSYKRV